MSLHAKVERLVRSRCDLSLRQLFVLGRCYYHGEQTVKALFEAGGEGIDKPGVSRAVDRLVELEFVTRKDDPKDRRSVLIGLTAAGRKFTQANEKA